MDFFCNGFAKWHPSGHGCILVESIDHGFANFFVQARVHVKVWKSLTKVDGLYIFSEATHDGKDVCAYAGQLCFDFRHAVKFRNF